MKITLKQLYVFNAIARSGQVAKAADIVNISAPATSMALGELEKQLGARLFERRSNKLLLNAQGSLLLPLADEVLERVEQIETAFTKRKTSFSGRLAVSASSTIGNYILAAASVSFGQLHPDVHIDLDIGNTRDAIQSVVEGRSEMAFIEGYCLDKRLKIENWHHDYLQIFSKPEHPFANKTVEARSLKHQNWVLREEGSGTREVFVHNAMEQNMQPIEAYSFTRPEAVKLAVEQGGGLGVLSILTLKQEFISQRLAPIYVSNMPLIRPFFKVRHGNRQSSAIGLAFEEFCNDWITHNDIIPSLDRTEND